MSVDVTKAIETSSCAAPMPPAREWASSTMPSLLAPVQLGSSPYQVAPDGEYEAL